jgi:hypothetical protein
MKGGLEVRGKNFYPTQKDITGKYIRQEMLAWRNWIAEQKPGFFCCTGMEPVL